MIYQRIIVLAIILCAPFTLAQKVYKTVTDDGKIIFSDTPDDSSKEIDTQLTNLHEGTEIPPPTAPEATPEPESYKIRLVSPIDGYQLGPAEQSLRISVAIKPKLSKDHYVDIRLNGTKVIKRSKSHNFTIPMGLPMRGKHTVSANIVDHNGKSIASSNSATFHVIRPN